MDLQNSLELFEFISETVFLFPLEMKAQMAPFLCVCMCLCVCVKIQTHESLCTMILD